MCAQYSMVLNFHNRYKLNLTLYLIVYILASFTFISEYLSISFISLVVMFWLADIITSIIWHSLKLGQNVQATMFKHLACLKILIVFIPIVCYKIVNLATEKPMKMMTNLLFCIIIILAHIVFSTPCKCIHYPMRNFMFFR